MLWSTGKMGSCVRKSSSAGFIQKLRHSSSEPDGLISLKKLPFEIDKKKTTLIKK